MRDLINRPEWVKDQYASDSNLNARIALHKRFGTSDVPWTPWVLDHVAAGLVRQFGTSEAGEFRVLELGCGPGTMWAENPGHLAASWKPFLSDLSPGMLATTQRNLARAGVDAHLLVAGAEQIPVDANICHGVIANHMLYHVQYRGRALEEIRRVLRTGGVLFAATNGEGHMHELHDLAHRFDPSQVPEDPSPRKFSLESGKRELGEYFAHVSVVHKENQLVVTEVEPLVAYMLSGSPTTINAEQEAKLRAFVEAEMANSGVIQITPVTGLLVAHD